MWLLPLSYILNLYAHNNVKLFIFPQRNCGRQITAQLLDCHSVIPGSCEYINVLGKRNFADVIKVKY